MLTTVAAVAVLVICAEACLLWVWRVREIHAEQAYWDQRDHRPYLYNWEVDGDA